MKIPFAIMPGSWGLKGKTREIAEAEYYYTDEKLDRRLAEIHAVDAHALALADLDLNLKYEHVTQYDHDVSFVKLAYKGATLTKELALVEYTHGFLTLYEFETKVANLELTGKALELKLLTIEHGSGNISDREFEKETATVNEESFISVVEIDSTNNSFEFDWNKFFIAELEDAGYGPAPKEEMIVEEWFNSLCKNIALTAFEGDGSMDDLEDQEKERKENMVKVTDIGNGRKEIT